MIIYKVFFAFISLCALCWAVYLVVTNPRPLVYAKDGTQCFRYETDIRYVTKTTGRNCSVLTDGDIDFDFSIKELNTAEKQRIEKELKSFGGEIINGPTTVNGRTITIYSYGPIAKVEIDDRIFIITAREATLKLTLDVLQRTAESIEPTPIRQEDSTR